MGVKEFFRPTKKKIILFMMIAVISLLSNGIKIASFGRPLTLTERFLNTIPAITSPGIHALFADNGFFIGYKPYGAFDMILEGIFHLGIDLVYWYILAGLIILIISKIKSR